jgi:para-nitrobenzyl esterase
MQTLSSGNDSFFTRILEGSDLPAWKEFLIKRVVNGMPVAPVSEDCLYLNIRTPAVGANGALKTKDLPVMVWIHGGGHQFGSADFAYYQDDRLAQEGVVLVTINYRLGAFGYLAHPALSADDPRGVSGNYGALDQMAALKWVQDNIRAYGGDPENVTIFGESAGAWSVTEMMASPLAKGLFHKAIGQSGSSVYHMGQMKDPGIGWVSGYASAEKLDAALGLTQPSAEALRALPAADIQAVITEDIAEGFNHVADGVVFPQSVGLAFQSGEFNNVPSLFGYNADEGTLFFPTDPNPTVWNENFPIEGTRADMIFALEPDFPAQAERLVDLYALDHAPNQGGMDMMGDEIFGMNIRWTAEQVEKGGQPAYVYSWNRVPIGKDQTVGAFHSAELPFVFDSYNPILGYSDEDKALTELMVGYWTNFAKTGDPNCAEAAECTLPDWPLYQGENWLAMEANTGKATRAVKHWRKDKLDALTEGLELKLSMLRAKTAGEMNAEPVAAGTSDLQLAVPSNE